MAPLPGKNSVKIPVEGFWFHVLHLVTFAARVRRQWSQGTFWLASRLFPIQPVSLPLVTNEFLRVLLCLAAVFYLVEILRLSIHNRIQDLDRRQFILPNPPRKYFTLGSVPVEIPSPRGILGEFERNRIVLRPQCQHQFA